MFQRLFLLMGSAGLLLLPVKAQVARPMNLVDLIRQAQHIVVAQCEGAYPESLSMFNQLPITRITLGIHKTFKGRPQKNLSIKQYGSKHLACNQTVTPAAQLILLYPPSGAGLTSPVGLEQGLFRIFTDELGETRLSNGRGNRGLFTDVPLVGLPPLEQREIAQANEGSALRWSVFTKLLRSLGTQEIPREE